MARLGAVYNDRRLYGRGTIITAASKAAIANVAARAEPVILPGRTQRRTAASIIGSGPLSSIVAHLLDDDGDRRHAELHRRCGDGSVPVGSLDVA
jgi:hypothetical protein